MRRTAQAEAIRASTEMPKHLVVKFWDSTGWMMKVKDEAGCRLFTLRFSAEEHEA